jgi:beta-glucanase (GH16 family)
VSGHGRADRGRGAAPSRQPARAGAAFRLVGIVEDPCGYLTGAGPQLAVGAGVSDSWSVVFERVVRRMLVAVACVLGVGAWSGCGAADARAAQLSIHAVPGGRVSLRLRGPVGSGAHDFRLDGKRLSRTRRRAITVVVARRWVAGDPLARWRVLKVRRAGSRRVLARARFALGVSRSRAAPTLVLLKAPPPRMTSTRAVLRFSVSSRTASCGHDGSRFRPCSSPIAYNGLSSGSHSFSIRAANRHGTTRIRVASTVLAPSSGTPPPTNSPAQPPATAPDGRRLAFADDFDGTVLNATSWRPYNSAGNAGNGLRRGSAIQLDGGGSLVITAQMVDGQLVSGGMSNRQSYTYGWFEFRVRTEPDPTGTLSGVVLTWPESGRWPVDGENDIYETGADAGTRFPFHSYVHYGAANDQYRFTHPADAAQWHTMAMDWRPDAISFYRDGTLVATLTDVAAIPDVAHHLCVQLDATATRQLTMPVRMFLDYVRIYQ